MEVVSKKTTFCRLRLQDKFLTFFDIIYSNKWVQNSTQVKTIQKELDFRQRETDTIQQVPPRVWHE